MLEHHQQQQQQQQQQQTTQHIQQLQYPLPHHVPGSTQPHPLSHSSPHLTPSPTNRMMLRRYSPLCLHLQLNEHQKRKKEKRERRQERRAEKKRLAEHEMALRIQMERESDESAIAREIARIEQSQLSQRGQTPATRQVQQSLTATLASPTYTNALMMQLEKLSGAQRIEHTTETTTHIQQQQQQQQHNNPAAALPPRPSNKYSPTSSSPGPTTPTLHPTAHSPSALPVTSCPLPNSSYHLSTSTVSTQHIPAPLNPSLMSNTLTPHSPPSFRPVTSTTEMPTTSPGSHQRQLLTHDPESTSPSLTSRFLLANLSKHEKHEYTYSPTIPQIHDDECVELMDCAIEDIPTHEDEDVDETPMSLSQAITSPPLSDHSSPAVMSETTSPSSKSLFSSFQHLLIHEHDEHEYENTHTSFHVPHASYVSFGKEMV